MTAPTKEYWPIDKLRNWDNNPRTISEDNFNRLKEQIKELGEYKPLLVCPDGEVIGGNMRLRAYRELGFIECWVSVVEPKNDEEKLKYALSDNDRVGRYDDDSLANLLGNYPDLDLSNYSVDLKDPLTIHELLDQFTVVEEDGGIDVIQGEPISKAGEVYQLGRHRLMCGDSTKSEQVAVLMGGNKADMVFTDPPYNVDYSYDWRPEDLHKGKKVAHHFFNDKMSNEDYGVFIRDIFMNGYVFTKDHANYYCWYAMKHHEIVKRAIENAGWFFSQLVIWVKNAPVLSLGQQFHRTHEPCLHGWKKGKKAYHNRVGSYRDILNWEDMDHLFDLWYERRDNVFDYVHPTQKPVRLAERAIKKSCPVDGSVLEFFGGSGSTLIACEQLGRTCYAMELDPLYCDAIRRRYAKFIGKEEEWQTITPQINR